MWSGPHEFKSINGMDKPYWYNHETAQSSWDDPVELYQYEVYTAYTLLVHFLVQYAGARGPASEGVQSHRTLRPNHHRTSGRALKLRCGGGEAVRSPRTPSYALNTPSTQHPQRPKLCSPGPAGAARSAC